jgi:hypothetical protein
MTRQRRRSQHARYGARHKAMREAALRALIPGVTLCTRCRLPLPANPALVHLDHADDGRGYRGAFPHLSHATCNTTAPHAGAVAVGAPALVARACDLPECKHGGNWAPHPVGPGRCW